MSIEEKALELYPVKEKVNKNGTGTFDTNRPRREAFIEGARYHLQLLKEEAVERTVKVDAGGYPYIDETELYDYTEDKPLAKEGDIVGVILIRKE